ncbi:hypothetical protein PATSB16_17140 [Pandoraea thiooxydans]|nr:hypothetical protein PATSB16_17140 [Pandoraea thiooxydans]
MLLNYDPDQVELSRPDLESLLESKLVEWEKLDSGAQRPRLTLQGRYVLQNVI